MADNDINRWKKVDATTGITEIGGGSHFTIPNGMNAACKAAALSGFEDFQAWLVANLPAGSMKTWHTSTAPTYVKTFVWEAAKI